MNLIKNYQLILTQIKSLNLMFETRREQLKKAVLNINNNNNNSVLKPVQRVEPVQKQSIQKRESMIRACDKGNIYDLTSNPTTTLSSVSTSCSSSVRSSSLNVKLRRKPSGRQNTADIISSSSSTYSSSSSSTSPTAIEQERILNEKKIKHILNELLDTERLYVNELNLVIQVTKL